MYVKIEAWKCHNLPLGGNSDGLGLISCKHLSLYLGGYGSRAPDCPGVQLPPCEIDPGRCQAESNVPTLEATTLYMARYNPGLSRTTSNDHTLTSPGQFLVRLVLAHSSNMGHMEAGDRASSHPGALRSYDESCRWVASMKVRAGPSRGLFCTSLDRPYFFYLIIISKYVTMYLLSYLLSSFTDIRK